MKEKFKIIIPFALFSFIFLIQFVSACLINNECTEEITAIIYDSVFDTDGDGIIIFYQYTYNGEIYNGKEYSGKIYKNGDEYKIMINPKNPKQIKMKNKYGYLIFSILGFFASFVLVKWINSKK